MLTSIRVNCPRCGAEKVYMGSKLAIIETSKRPIRLRCGKCGAYIKINGKSHFPLP